MEWQKGSKLHKNRMVWTQIFKDTEASKGTNTIWKWSYCVSTERQIQKNYQSQKKIKKEIQLIKSSDKTVAFADKTPIVN